MNSRFAFAAAPVVGGLALTPGLAALPARAAGANSRISSQRHTIAARLFIREDLFRQGAFSNLNPLKPLRVPASLVVCDAARHEVARPRGIPPGRAGNGPVCRRALLRKTHSVRGGGLRVVLEANTSFPDGQGAGGRYPPLESVYRPGPALPGRHAKPRLLPAGVSDVRGAGGGRFSPGVAALLLGHSGHETAGRRAGNRTLAKLLHGLHLRGIRRADGAMDDRADQLLLGTLLRAVAVLLRLANGGTLAMAAARPIRGAFGPAIPVRPPAGVLVLRYRPGGFHLCARAAVLRA